MSLRDWLRKPELAAPNPAPGPATESPEESAPPPPTIPKPDRGTALSGTGATTPIGTLPRFNVGDRIADTYAMEVTFYYLLMGQYPYNFPAPAEIQAFQQQNRKLWDRPEEAIQALMQLRRIMHPFQIILEETPIPIRQRDPSIPETLAAVVDRAVQKEIAKRFQSAEEFRQAIQAVK